MASSEAATANLTTDEISEILHRLTTENDQFWFGYVPRSWDRRLRWVAERVNTADPGLHTVITDDLGELEDALRADAARAAGMLS